MTARILVRYGEIALKGRNRGQFEQQLHRNLKGAVKICEGDVERLHGRFVVSGPGESRELMLERLSRVFGVVSISPVVEAPLDLEEIKEAALKAAIEKGCHNCSFKVAARRANKKFPYQSPELNRIIGTYLAENIPSLSVDLFNPDFTLSLEIGYDRVFIYLENIPGPGGLPVGITGSALLLLSGGIDSPAAGWLAMKRGLGIEALHFHSFPFTGKQSQEKTVELCRRLTRYTHKITLHMISVTELQKELRSSCPEELGVILLRRMMLRLAERLCNERALQALVTGENLGQVASQTLESIDVISRAAGMLILRPLVGLDKSEIIGIAQKIDTYETSVLPYEDCCTLFVPKSPVTKPKLAVVENCEKKLDLEKLLADSYATLESEIIRR